MPLSAEQLARAVEVMQEYLHAPPTADGPTPVQRSAEGDKQRVELIAGELGQLVAAYLAGNVPLEEFKTKIDSVNKRHENWGFKGIKGQMFFNKGMGRVPDGLAFDSDNSYAIMWDGKIRESGYNMGTDDRAIREYVHSQGPSLRRFRNIYYLVVSSKFLDDFDSSIRSIKMETEISEVCLLEAAALVAMVEIKLRNPLQVSLGADGIQQLFSNSGIITAETVAQTIG
jgi:hypothetical protein